MNTQYFVYALICPHSGLIKYVGYTNDPKQRLTAHMKSIYLSQWVNKVRAKGIKMNILCSTENKVQAMALEQNYIIENSSTVLNDKRPTKRMMNHAEITYYQNLNIVGKYRNGESKYFLIDDKSKAKFTAYELNRSLIIQRIA